MDGVRISILPPAPGEGEGAGDDHTENTTPREQETSTSISNGPDEDDEELGCYHCREESPTGIIGRIVAVYRPSRPANRARDRPAMSSRLEIFAELGERCETAMMFMCMRLDDLFTSIPAERKGLFATARSPNESGSQNPTIDPAGGAGTETNYTHGDGNGVRGENGSQARDEQRLEVSIMKRLLGSRDTWKTRLKLVVAAILIVVVLVLVLKPKFAR